MSEETYYLMNEKMFYITGILYYLRYYPAHTQPDHGLVQLHLEPHPLQPHVCQVQEGFQADTAQLLLHGVIQVIHRYTHT